MADHQRYLTHRYRSVPPQDEEEIACDVCGFGNDGLRTATSPQTIFAYTTEGTVYHDPNPLLVDVIVRPVQPAYTNCALCGSNRWRSGGRRGDL
jgi:hypothetical protein